MASTGTDATDRLKEAASELLKALSGRAFGAVSHTVGGLTDRLDDVASGGPLKGAVAGAAGSAAGGESAAGGALKGALSGLKDKVTGGGGGGAGKSGGGKATKATTIIEEIDVGVPLRVAYNQWTEFDSFPHFMKKVERAEAEEENKISWKAQILWSHRSWEATILEQVPDERIVWRSKGEKGHVDGAVTFHEIGPNLTRIVVVLEYYPQGLFEKTGNIWRAQGRRARAELQHFRRHVMTRTILDPEAVEGWRGEIRDGEVVMSHEDALQQEEQGAQEEGEREPEGEGEGGQEEPEDEYEEEEPEGDEDEYEEEEEGEEPEDEDEYEEEEPEGDEDEYEEEEEEGEEEPEDEEEEGPEDEGDYEDEDEYEEEEEEPEEEPEEQPAPTRRRARR